MEKLDLKNASAINKMIGWCMQNKLVVTLIFVGLLITGVMVAPFDWEIPGLIRSPIAVDAIPDIGENQQIIFTPWPGRSPQDVEDQVGYPLTVALLGVPGVKTVRSYSMFGFSSIYVIFKEKVDFYWSRSRLLEKLSSLPMGTLPDGVRPMLGPDATALGQVFWYTLEGRDSKGNPTGGWDLEELRSIQDWKVRYSLLSADGVAEVASIGGFVKEYQIDVNPEAMRAYNIGLEQIYKSIKMSNLDVGARTIEINNVEYVIRGIGFIKSVADIEKVVLKVVDGVPVSVKDIAHVNLGPAMRRGVLDKGGAEAVGGVVVTRYGSNPLQTIKNVKQKLREIEGSLPVKTLADGRVSQVKIIPFYDRTGLIQETLGTLKTALSDEMIFTIIVILFMVMNLKSSLLVSSLMPAAVLVTFIGMKLFNIEANIVALSGIAIAIGTIVEVGVVLCENMLQHLARQKEGENLLVVLHRATSEVSGAVFTAVATTVVGFLPVFFMEGPEGKLFKPLAYTKTMALMASIALTLTVLPAYAHLLFGLKTIGKKFVFAWLSLLFLSGLAVAVTYSVWIGLLIIAVAAMNILRHSKWKNSFTSSPKTGNYLIIAGVVMLLAEHWLPLGPEKGYIRNLMFVGIMITAILGGLHLLQVKYLDLLKVFLNHKKKFLLAPALCIFLGLMIWHGSATFFFWLPKTIKQTSLFQSLHGEFPGIGKEFMPDLDEGSFLFMPTTMTHASLGEAYDILKTQDKLIQTVPEVETVVGKLGRAETPLDPAPISMFETIVNYKSEYKIDEHGHRINFKYNRKTDEFERDAFGKLIPDKGGRPFRQWRPEIQSIQDIWDEIVKASKLTGVTSAPKLQPIKARIVMLQSGMRAPMGVKVYGSNLENIERIGIEIEKILKTVPSIEPSSVVADRIVGKPYLQFEIDRDAIARYGLHIQTVQNVIEVAIGGKPLMSTVEGRERYPVRVRYQRELRNSLEELHKIVVPTGTGAQIPITQLATIEYVKGPQVIKSEDTFLIGYVVFDKKPDYAEVDVVHEAQRVLREQMDKGFLKMDGAHYKFAGNYENQIRSEKRMMLVLPLALFLILLLIYFEFKRIPTTLLVFSGVFVAWSGGFIMLYLYSKPWFLNFSVFGTSMRDLFQIHGINLSIAVWVGFLALFGVATDDGVVMTTYLDQSFKGKTPKSIAEIREWTLRAASRRIRPALMTVSTILLALIPILTSTGKGSDVMVPMAIPSFGGMSLVLITVFVVPVIYCLLEERKFLREQNKKG